MHPLKIVVLLVLFYLLYRLYVSGRKKRLEDKKSGRDAAAISDVLVQDPVCGAYVAKGQALVLRDQDGSERHFCSDKCRRTFIEQKQNSSGGTA
ncbi:MAG TPA: YHS domain-containing protein [Desulfurivibrio alkaliphilus]|uniref:YHS domain-containing protein n=1 Tax=Desulfurivibrio alkaliphilus TaxID=427923 RepID=A0A7C2XV72_9BACT|nr:YHS domain-containing protein [Desulfurivibrio alkaliphilus]